MKDGLSQDDLNEDCPILMQKDFQTTIRNIAELPDYLKKISDNIINIDKRISKKELNTDKVKQLNTHCTTKENKVKCSNDLFELNTIVKKSTDCIYDILGGRKNPIIIEAIEEENMNKDDLELNYKPKGKPSHKWKPKEMELNQIISPEKRKGYKKPINDSKASNKKNNQHKGDIMSQIHKGVIGQTSHKANRIEAQYNMKRKSKVNDRLLNNSYNTFVHLTNEQSLKNIANSKGLASSSDIKKDSNNNNIDNDNRNNNNENDNIGKATNVHSKEKKSSSKNNFSFKPKANKGSLNYANDASISSESQIKVMPCGLQKANTFIANKNQSTSKKGSTDIHQRILTEQNKPSSASSNKNNTTNCLKTQEKISITRHSQSKQLYSHKKDNNAKGVTTKDILGLMLFFNEYILSTNTVKPSAQNRNLLETVSISLAKALRSISSNQNNEPSSSIERGDEGLSNERMIESVLKLQRKWRRYKVKDILLNNSQHNAKEKNLIKSMIVNNFIEKEGFSAKRLIGMINSSIESFLLLKNNKRSTEMLAEVSLNRLSDDDRYALYKKFINKQLSKAHFEYDYSNNNTMRNSNDDKYYDSILSKIRIGDTKTK